MYLLLPRYSFRYLAQAFICFLLAVVLTFSSLFLPSNISFANAAAYNRSTSSNLNKGEDKLKQIEKKSEDFLKPENTFSPEKIREEAQKGPNEVQGDADLDKMKNPSNSFAADTPESQIERALDKVTGS